MLKRYFPLAILTALCVSLPQLNASAAECSDIESCKKIPGGFTFYESKNQTGSFLRPDKWFLKEEVNGETRALFITKEDIDVAGHFLTGLAVNKVPSVMMKTKRSASKYARNVADRLRATGIVLRAGVVRGNSVDMNIVRKKLDKGGVPVIVHYITIGNDDTDTFYLISFEAPESSWEEDIQVGTPMLNFFAL